MSTSVSVYLQNHEAAGQAGHDLFRRVASAQRRRAYGPDLDSSPTTSVMTSPPCR